jgi:hypothetical protein
MPVFRFTLSPVEYDWYTVDGDDVPNISDKLISHAGDTVVYVTHRNGKRIKVYTAGNITPTTLYKHNVRFLIKCKADVKQHIFGEGTFQYSKRYRLPAHQCYSGDVHRARAVCLIMTGIVVKFECSNLPPARGSEAYRQGGRAGSVPLTVWYHCTEIVEM